MLNLSDKELDRLAREAASEYDPGDLTGPRSWDRMQSRLDVEMGSPRFNLFRSFRRTSFYYAPAAIILLAGATYFLFRPTRNHSSTHPPGSPAMAQAEPSGSPPPIGVNATKPSSANTDGSIKNQNNTYSPNSTQATPSSVSGATADHDATTGHDHDAAASSSAAVSSIATSHSRTVPYPGTIASSGATAHPGTITPSGAATSSGSTVHPGGTQAPSGAAAHPGMATPYDAAADVDTDPGATAPSGMVSSHSPGALSSNGSRPHHNRPGSNSTRPSSNGELSDSHPTIISGSDHASNPGSGRTMASTTNSLTGMIPSSSPAPLSYSMVKGIRGDRPVSPVIDDAPLRKLNSPPVAKAPETVNPGKPASQSLHINRRLQLGLSIAPEFTSVNSLAGDKPGSDIGITVSYQFFSRLHLQTGFLLSHRNYTAAQQDYHVPYDYYRMNNMHDVYFVKGNINLYEIPLNIRYDFSVSGNTSFFVSGGVSSYLLTHENCNYYFDLFGRPVYQEFQYDNHQNSLFGTVNLSMGVETGLTNSLSFMVAPYMKLPTTGLGFGKIKMNSIGVEFGIKYAPVLRRKRH